MCDAMGANGICGATWASGVWTALGIVLVLLVVAGAATAAVILTRHGSAPRQAQPGSPTDILQRRYAAGEIEEEEYQRRMSGLKQH